jgi:hypothetical protein
MTHHLGIHKKFVAWQAVSQIGWDRYWTSTVPSHVQHLSLNMCVCVCTCGNSPERVYRVTRWRLDLSGSGMGSWAGCTEPPHSTNTTVLWDLRFSQWFSWGFKSSGMWYCVILRVCANLNFQQHCCDNLKSHISIVLVLFLTGAKEIR